MIESTLQFDDIEVIPGLFPLLWAVERSRMRLRGWSRIWPGNKATVKAGQVWEQGYYMCGREPVPSSQNAGSPPLLFRFVCTQLSCPVLTLSCRSGLASAPRRSSTTFWWPLKLACSSAVQPSCMVEWVRPTKVALLQTESSSTGGRKHISDGTVVTRCTHVAMHIMMKAGEGQTTTDRSSICEVCVYLKGALKCTWSRATVLTLLYPY